LKVRLHAIDAPECGMPFGPQAQAFLEKLILGRTVQMETMGRDRYHRTVATLAVDDLDVGLAMLRAGLAWHDQRYNRPRLPDSTIDYTEAQRGATLNLAGLWAESERIAPWLWRTGAYQTKGRPQCSSRVSEDGLHPPLRSGGHVLRVRRRPLSVQGVQPSTGRPQGRRVRLDGRESQRKRVEGRAFRDLSRPASWAPLVLMGSWK
jgi:hypothetical protein